MKWLSRLIVVPLAVSLPTWTAAQTPSALPKAAEAKAPARPTAYRSVFDNYVPANEDKAIAWRDANALVKEIGGWRVYARESHQPVPANTVTPAARSSVPHEKH